MKALESTLPVDVSPEYIQSVDELKTRVAAAIRPGDVVVVKSSNGIGFSKLVEHLVKQFPPVIKAAQEAG